MAWNSSKKKEKEKTSRYYKLSSLVEIWKRKITFSKWVNIFSMSFLVLLKRKRDFYNSCLKRRWHFGLFRNVKMTIVPGTHRKLNSHMHHENWGKIPALHSLSWLTCPLLSVCSSLHCLVLVSVPRVWALPTLTTVTSLYNYNMNYGLRLL